MKKPYHVSTKPRSVAALLRAARKLITPPDAWRKSTLAGNAAGGVVSPSSLYACSWCSIGAVDAFSPRDKMRDAALGFLDVAISAYTGRPRRSQNSFTRVWLFNDSYYHQAVLDVFDEAIKRATAAAKRRKK